MKQLAITSSRGLLMLVAFPALFFVIVATLPPQKLGFSAAHKSEIEAIAFVICASVKVSPCQVQWSGKQKWFATLNAIASPTDLRNALPPPEWSLVEEPMEFKLSNTGYVVTYLRDSGNIVVTSIK